MSRIPIIKWRTKAKFTKQGGMQMSIKALKKQPKSIQPTTSFDDADNVLNDNNIVEKTLASGWLSRVAKSLTNKKAPVQAGANDAFDKLAKSVSALTNVQTYKDLPKRAAAVGAALRNPEVQKQVAINMGVGLVTKFGVVSILSATAAPAIVSTLALGASTMAVGFVLKTAAGYSAEKKAWASDNKPTTGEPSKSFWDYAKKTWKKNLGTSFLSASVGAALGFGAHSLFGDHITSLFGAKPSEIADVASAKPHVAADALPTAITDAPSTETIVTPDTHAAKEGAAEVIKSAKTDIVAAPAPQTDDGLTAIDHILMQNQVEETLKSGNIEDIKALAANYANGTGGMPKDEAGALALTHYAADKGDVQSIIELANKGELSTTTNAVKPVTDSNIAKIVEAAKGTMTEEQIEASRVMKVDVLRENGVSLSDKNIIGHDVGTYQYDPAKPQDENYIFKQETAQEGDFMRYVNKGDNTEIGVVMTDKPGTKVTSYEFMRKVIINSWDRLNPGQTPPENIAAAAKVPVESVALNTMPSPTFGG